MNEGEDGHRDAQKERQGVGEAAKGVGGHGAAIKADRGDRARVGPRYAQNPCIPVFLPHTCGSSDFAEMTNAPSVRLIALLPGPPPPALTEAARRSGFTCVGTTSMGAFLDALAEAPAAACILSLTVETVDERVALRIGESPNCGTLLLSADRVSLEAALLMERAGAVAILREPFDADEVEGHLHHVVDQGPIIALPEVEQREGPTLVGSSPAMGRILQLLARVAPTPSTVLVTGESGTGKEVVAQVLHWASPRNRRPFVAVNCAAIPEHLLESELFGHERGAFTGAVARRVGRFERADGGTLFLDEIGDMSLVLQAKILRVLEERRLERVGSEESLDVDVRIVAATNQDLRSRIDSGDFREDLYYRLAVVEVTLPPLRQRGGDIRELALHFAAHFAARYQRPLSGITLEALQRLETYPWPGNVRELRNVMDRAILLAGSDALRAGELRIGAGSPRASAQATPGGGDPYSPTLTLEQVEADYITKVLAAQDGHMGRTAEVLGIHRNTLTRKVQSYGIGVDAAGEDGATIL